MIISKDIGGLTIDVGGVLLATLIGGYAGVKMGKGWGKLAAQIVGAGASAFLWNKRSDIQDFITWLNEKQIIEIDLESILENILDSIDTTQNLMQEYPFDMAFTLIYQALSIQEPKLRELISKEFQILINETPEEIITGNLTNEEFQSLVALLCNKKCNVNDVHSFLECSSYLSQHSPTIESHITDSPSTQSNTTLTTKESTDSKTITPNNNNPTPNTFPFSLHIKDYNTFAPLTNKQIQITNIDSKQTYTQTTKNK